jgi:lipoate-protein ligase A
VDKGDVLNATRDPQGVRTVLIEDGNLPGGPAHDVELGRVLLRQGMDSAPQMVRIYVPEPTAAFSQRDTLRPGFRRAAETARGLGFVPVVRPQGGRLAAYHRGSVVIDHVMRESNAQAALRERFEQYAQLHLAVLVALGLDARIGELPGEYCPGEHSVNAGGVSKIVGSAQRVTRDGWLFSSIVQVTDSTSIRQMLIRVYEELGYELEPSTIGAVDDFVPGVTAELVAGAFRREYARRFGAVPATLSPELLLAVSDSVRANTRV